MDVFGSRMAGNEEIAKCSHSNVEQNGVTRKILQMR